jgi:GntR family transcriptional regulator
MALGFIVSLSAGMPIYEQVVRAVKKSIVSGELKIGQQFPSVRELSRELKINPNTAQKILENLVREKLVEVRPGIGSVICAGSAPNEERSEIILGDKLSNLIVDAKALGVDKATFLKAVEKHWMIQKHKVK